MKRTLSLVLILCMCFALSACGPKIEVVKLTPETPEAHESIKEYYRIQDVGHAEGELYRAKMLACTKVLFHNAGYDFTSTNYLYRIALVPKTTRLTKELTLQVYPTNGLDGPMTKHDSSKPPSSVNTQNEWFDAWSPFDAKEVSDIVAYDFLFSLSNESDQWQANQGISNEVLDQGMTLLRIEVNADGEKDTILLPFTGELPVVDSKDDPLAVSNPYVMAILEREGGRSYGVPLGEKP